MAQMFEEGRDVTGFTEDYDPNAEPGATAEAPAAEGEAPAAEEPSEG
jgi:large subunit ribosomal protein L9